MIVRNNEAEFRKEAAKFTIEQMADIEYVQMMPVWSLVDDVLAGELAVKSHDNKYIYRPEQKNEKAWAAYKGRGKLPDYAKDTLQKMVGTLGAAPATVKLDGKAARLDFMREVATPYHDGLDALSNRVHEQILRSGRYCLLLEPDEEGDRFHINEYKCRKYLRAKIKRNDGETYAEMVMLDTSKIEYNTRIWQDVYYPQITVLALDGAGRYYQAKFGGGEDDPGLRIKEYGANGLPVYDQQAYVDTMGGLSGKLQSFDIYNPDPAKCDELIYPNKYGRLMDRIPFVAITPLDLSLTKWQNPPLLKLCLHSLHILDADCTYQTALFLTGDPVPVVSGLESRDKLFGGSDHVMFLPDGAGFSFVSPSGSGLGEQAANLERMHEQAKNMGLTLSGENGIANTPVGTMTLYRNSQTAELMGINQNCGKAIELILRYAGRWLGMTEEEVNRDISFTPSDEFASVKATAQECAAVAAARAELQMTREEVRQYVEKNGLAPTKPWDEVQAELDAEKSEDEEAGMNSVAGAFGFERVRENGVTEEEAAGE